MSNDANGSTGDDTLTSEEELRFEQLFANSDRLTLGYDWVDAFLESVAEETTDRLDYAPAGRPGDGTTFAPVVSLADEREKRAWGPFLAVAAAFLIAIGVGASLLLSAGRTSNGGVDEIPLLDSSQEVEAPDLRPLAVPDGSFSYEQLDDGQTLVLAQPEDSESTILWATSDLTNYEERATLPIVDAIGDFTTDTWYLVGGDTESIVEFGQGPTSRVPTDLAVFASTDQGITWESIDIEVEQIVDSHDLSDPASLPFSETQAHEVSVAVIDDTVLVGYTAVPVTDWTALAREFDLVDDETEVVRIAGVFDNYWAVGPNRFERLAIEATDVDMERTTFDNLNLADDPVVARSVDGQPFEKVSLPQEMATNPIIFAPIVDTYDGEFLITNPVFMWNDEALTSSNGIDWEEQDGDFLEQINTESETELTVNRNDWKLRFRFDDELVAEQRTSDEAQFSLVPRPEVQAGVQLGFETDFGAAIVWQDNQANSLLSIRSTVQNNGYTFEFFDNWTVAVTAPDGTVVSERQGLSGVPQDRIVLDSYGTIRLYDDDASVLASVTLDELFEAYFTTGIRAENPPARFISWATAHDDWKFAELEGISAALWDFQELDEGLLATAGHDPSEALFIEWPAEFGE